MPDSFSEAEGALDSVHPDPELEQSVRSQDAEQLHAAAASPKLNQDLALALLNRRICRPASSRSSRRTSR